MRFLYPRNRAIVMFIFSFLFISIFCIEAEAKFVNTFIIRIGGNALKSGDEAHLAKHSIIFAQKFHYDDIRGDTWQAIKSINPNAKIYLYTATAWVDINQDSTSAVNLNTLGRYNNSRGHSMGSLNGDNNNLFLFDSNGTRIRTKVKPNIYWLDFGNSTFHKYSVEATVADNKNKPWSADGVYTDCTSLGGTNKSAVPVKYNTSEKWVAGMKSQILAVSSGLHANGLKAAANAGPTYNQLGSDAWISMDRSASPPDVLLEEAAFAVCFGPGDIQFYGEGTWKKQLDLLGSLKNINACFTAGTDIAQGQIGIDNLGKSFNFYDALWYALGSYLVGKNDNNNNSFFQFYPRAQALYGTADVYYDEYGIDLGKSVDDYNVTAYSGNNIYWREFEKGYVYVNPTKSNVSSIRLPETCKQLTHNNLNTSPQTLPDISSISLNAHRAAILYKKNFSSSSAATGDVIIDNKDSGNVSFTGTWSESSGSYEWAGSSFWSRDGATFRFHFDCPETGRYEVFERHSLWPSRSNSVVMKIERDGSATPAYTTVNQKTGGQSWNSLGEFNYTAGLTYTVTVVSQPGPSSSCADTIMFRLK